jgi:[CysO sulfur-carrier protein]-S-L-cysteine hydrolase
MLIAAPWDVRGPGRPSTSVSPVRVPRPLYDELLAHAREDAPNECCGLIGGNDGEAKTVYRARNAEASPLRYNLDPQDQFRIMTEMDERGEELAAIYHSHTASPAYPSQTDINLAAYPDALYLIVSLAEGEKDLRGYRIVDGEVNEVELQVE